MSSRSSAGSALALCALIFGLAALWQSEQNRAARVALSELRAAMLARDPAKSRRGRAAWRGSLKKVESPEGSANAAGAFVFAEWVLCPARLETSPSLPIPEGGPIRAAPFKGGPSFDGLEETMLALLKPGRGETPSSIQERIDFYAPLLRALEAAPGCADCAWPWPDGEGDAFGAAARRRAFRWLFLMALIEKKHQPEGVLASLPALLAASVDLRARPGLGGFQDYLSSSALILRALLMALREPQPIENLKALQASLAELPEPALLECWKEESWRSELSIAQYAGSDAGGASDSSLAMVFEEASAELRKPVILLLEWRAFLELARQVEAAILAPKADLPGIWQAISHNASDKISAPLILQLDVPAARRALEGWRCLSSFARIALSVRLFEAESGRLPKERAELKDVSPSSWSDPVSDSGEDYEVLWSEATFSVASRGASGLKIQLPALKLKEEKR